MQFIYTNNLILTKPGEKVHFSNMQTCFTQGQETSWHDQQEIVTRVQNLIIKIESLFENYLTGVQNMKTLLFY